MRFSLIVPTLNEGKYIEKCLKSIENQSLKEKEIIIVDAFSKDNTTEIAKKYTNKIYFESKKGCAIARNIGAKHSKGEILVFVDADVILKKDFLERLDCLFKKGIAGATFPLNLYDTKNYSIKLFGFMWNFIVYIFNRIGFTMTTGCCFVYERNHFFRVNGFNNRLLMNEDHDLAIRVSKNGRFIMAPISIKTSSRRVKRYGLIKFIIFHLKSALTYFMNKKSNANYYS